MQDGAFLRSRAQTPDAPAWFRALYLWLKTHPSYESYFYYKWRERVRTYHEREFILTAGGELRKGGEVSVLYV